MNKIEQAIEKTCDIAWKCVLWFGIINFVVMLVRFAWALYLGKI